MGFFVLSGLDLGGWVGLLFCLHWSCSLVLCEGCVCWVVSWRLEKIFSLLSPWWVYLLLGLKGGFGVDSLRIYPGCLCCSGKFWEDLLGVRVGP